MVGDTVGTMEAVFYHILYPKKFRIFYRFSEGSQFFQIWLPKIFGLFPMYIHVANSIQFLCIHVYTCICISLTQLNSLHVHVYTRMYSYSLLYMLVYTSHLEPIRHLI